MKKKILTAVVLSSVVTLIGLKSSVAMVQQTAPIESIEKETSSSVNSVSNAPIKVSEAYYTSLQTIFDEFLEYGRRFLEDVRDDGKAATKLKLPFIYENEPYDISLENVAEKYFGLNTYGRDLYDNFFNRKESFSIAPISNSKKVYEAIYILDAGFSAIISSLCAYLKHNNSVDEDLLIYRLTRDIKKQLSIYCHEDEEHFVDDIINSYKIYIDYIMQKLLCRGTHEKNPTESFQDTSKSETDLMFAAIVKLDVEDRLCDSDFGQIRNNVIDRLKNFDFK